jgi:hypothetical protein
VAERLGEDLLERRVAAEGLKEVADRRVRHRLFNWFIRLVQKGDRRHFRSIWRWQQTGPYAKMSSVPFFPRSHCTRKALLPRPC